MSSALLTSSPFACGLAWLVNSLLALGYKSTSIAYGDENWEPVSEGKMRVTAKATPHLASHFPILIEKSSFSFRPNFEAFWEHRVGTDLPPGAPVVVMIRDPRDAIFSLHRRWVRHEWIQQDFPTFLNWPSEWPHHFPGLFHVTPLKTFMIFNLVWLRKARWRPVKFVRFEDLKAQPETNLKEILKFLSLPLPEQDSLKSAIASSSQATAKSSNGFNPNFKGEIFEWKSTYREEWLRPFSTQFAGAFLDLFKYESTPSTLTPKLLNMVRNFLPRYWFQAKVLTLLSLPFLFKLQRRLDGSRLQSILRRSYVAKFWGEKCSDFPAQKVDLVQFFLPLTALLLDREEVNFIFNHLTQSINETVC